MQPPDLWIVIPTYNRSQDLMACLNSLFHAEIREDRVIVIDNHSEDDTLHLIKLNYPKLHLIALSENKGASGASNVGFQYALAHKANLVLRLDSDVEVSPDFLQPLIKLAMSDPTIGVVGPKIYFFDPPDEIWYAGVNAHPWHFGGTHGFRHEKDSSENSYPRKVDYVWGAAMLIKSQVLKKTNGFDSQFFIYFEEVDFCRRAQKLGYELAFVPESHLWHKVGSSIQNSWTAYHWNKSKVLLYRKHAKNFFHQLTLITYAYIYALITSLYRHNTGNRGPLKDALRGLHDGLKMKIY